MANDVINELTRVKYVGQDFSTYYDEIANFLKQYYPDEYTDYVNNNMGVALLQQSAWSNQNLAFYINRRVTNLFLTQSSNATAISRIARMLNYDIEPAIPFRVEVTVKLSDGPYSFLVKIEKGFKFNAVNGLFYEYRLDNPVIYSPGETEKTFEVQEGTTTRNTFISNGEPNQIFLLTGLETGEFIAKESFELTVGPESWEENRRITFDATAQFEANYFSDPPEIKFGDGVAGLVPEENSEIIVNFIVTKGLAGAISSNQITGAADQLVVQNNNIPLEIVSSTEASGGDDPEDFRKVKRQAPEFYQSQDRAITKRDYDAIINTYPGVAKGDAQIIRSIDQDLTLNEYLDDIVDAVSGCSGTVQSDVTTLVGGLRTYLGGIISDTCKSNTVQVSVLTKNANNRYVSPTEQLKEDIRLHLEERNDIVHVVSVVDGTSGIIEADITVDILVDFNAITDDVIEAARLSLMKDDAEPYGLLILRDYGESLYLSDIYKSIRDSQANTTDIEYMNIKIVGPTEKLDSDGNLIIDARGQEIIQPGTVLVRAIARSIGV